jgi:hypothetical protein
MTKHTILWALCAVLSLPVWSEAQSLTTVYQVRIYLDGGAAPITTYDIAVADVRCGQPKVPAPGAVVNPSVLRWDDELNPTGHDCTWTDSGTGPLFALPISLTNVYRARMVAIDPIGTSPESAPSNPFSRRGLPAAPANVRMSRP